MALCFYLISIALILFGVWRRRTLINPLTVFVFVWFVTVLLAQLNLSGWQEGISAKLYGVLITMDLFFFVGYLLAFSFCKCSSGNLLSKDKLDPTIINRLFLLWFVVEIGEVVYSGGIPLLWKLMGSDKTYFDFGIPSIHGLMNSIGLVIVLLSALSAIENKELRTRSIVLAAGMAVYYTALLTRQVVISAAIEVVVLLLLKRPKQVLRKLVPVAFIGIIAFGVLGNIRTGYEAFLYVARIHTDIPPILIGFYWVYMYLTMSITNLNSLVTGSFPAVGMDALSGFVPSIVAPLFGIHKGFYSADYLVTPAFNVSGFFVYFYQGFKMVGVSIISVAYGALGGCAGKLREELPGDMSDLLFAVSLQIIILSFFDNLLLYLPNSFQLLLIPALFLIQRYFSHAKQKETINNE